MVLMFRSAMDLHPTKTSDLLVIGREDEAFRIEPTLFHADIEISTIPIPLIRMAGEGAIVEREPLVFVLADLKGSEWDGWIEFREGQIEGPAHLHDGSDTNESLALCEVLGAWEVSMGPEAKPRARELGNAVEKGPTEALGAKLWVDHKLCARSFDFVGEIEMGVANDSRFGILDDDMAIVFIAAVAKMEEDMFCDGRDAIISCRLGNEVKDSVKRVGVGDFVDLHDRIDQRTSEKVVSFGLLLKR